MNRCCLSLSDHEFLSILEKGDIDGLYARPLFTTLREFEQDHRCDVVLERRVFSSWTVMTIFVGSRPIKILKCSPPPKISPIVFS